MIKKSKILRQHEVPTFGSVYLNPDRGGKRKGIDEEGERERERERERE